MTFVPVETDISKGQVVAKKLLSMMLCVPSGWTDTQVEAFAESQDSAGTLQGWRVTQDGSSVIGGAKSRVACREDSRRVHVVVEAVTL